MKQKLSPEERNFYKRVDEILFYRRDPIGISDSDWPRNEYKTYVPQVFRIALKNDEPELVAEYLCKIETDYLDMKGRKYFNMRVAELILEI
jgi:hypothetical protein